MAIDLTPEVVHAAGYRAVDRIAALLESLPQRPVVPEREPSIIRTQLGNGLPEEGMDPEELVDWIAPPPRRALGLQTWTCSSMRR